MRLMIDTYKKYWSCVKPHKGYYTMIFISKAFDEIYKSSSEILKNAVNEV